jgi:membrane-bound ClpP family serine protease
MNNKNCGIYKISGFLLGMVFSFFAVLIGLIFIACSNTEEDKFGWKIFTKFSMLGIAALMTLWAGSCFTAMVYASASSNNTTKINNYTKNKIGDDCNSSYDCEGSLVCKNNKCHYSYSF